MDDTHKGMPVNCKILVLFTLLIPVILLNTGCRQRIIDQRINDVKHLLTIHASRDYTNSEISQLLAIAERDRIKIVNPIPKNRFKDCYRLMPDPVSSERRSISDAANIVIIEETSNVADDTWIVRAYADLTIRVERKRTR